MCPTIHQYTLCSEPCHLTIDYSWHSLQRILVLRNQTIFMLNWEAMRSLVQICLCFVIGVAVFYTTTWYRSSRDSKNQSRVSPLSAIRFSVFKLIRGKIYELPAILGIKNTAPQAGRPRVRFSMVSLEFFINIILPTVLWPWGWLSL